MKKKDDLKNWICPICGETAESKDEDWSMDDWDWNGETWIHLHHVHAWERHKAKYIGDNK